MKLPRITALCRAAVLLAALLASGGAGAAEPIPLPRPRPADLGPPTVPLPPLRPAIAPQPETQAPPTPSACQLGLMEIAAVEVLPPITGANGCGIDEAVRIAAVKGKDDRRIAITPPATLRCAAASAIAHWLREDVQPLAATLGAPLAGVANFDSYECRGRNRVAGAIISEHGKGNAIDIRALTLTNGRSYELTDVHVDRDVREKLRASACARFTTVLGPESDGFHENHVHVDIQQRRSGYRICQWAVHDPSEPKIPLPRERPPEAPR